MKVKCTKIFNKNSKEFLMSSSWLTVGKEYVVLSIVARKDKVLFLIESDSSDQPILQDAIQFDVINKKIPKTWKIATGSLELFSVGPDEWHRPGFWEDCYDLDPKALEIYKREARIIYEEEEIL